MRHSDHMLHLIEKLLPAPVHRALLPAAFQIRHRWRRWRKTDLAGCCVIISNLSGGVLLLRHSYGPKVWALPGGGIATGEDPEDAARREVLEELGLTLGALETIGKTEETVSGSRHTAYLFAAVSDQRPKPDKREVMEARFFPTHSLPEPLGKITRARIDIWRRRRPGAE
ncbi:MAG: NUDIX domain-containing protein [Pseudomonadota bacterium]